MTYQYQPEVDQPVAELHMTDPGALQLKIYGVTTEAVHNPRDDERKHLEAKVQMLNARASEHPDRQELREHRAANAVAIPAMRSLAAAYQRLLKVIEKAKPIVTVRKNHPINEKSSYLGKPRGLLREGDKLYSDQFVLPAHMLYTLQRNLHQLRHQIDHGKTINMELVTQGLALVEKTMTHYDLPLPHPAETDELARLDHHHD